MDRSKSIAKRLRKMDWRYVREVVLTIDPKKWDDPETVYLEIRGKKSIPQIIHNFERTKGRNIKDWVWCLEFHRSGHPHWHLFVEAEVAGKAGMLTGEALRQYWRYGAVYESFVKDENHWNNLTDYFGRKGYFQKDKAHQGRLPEWALKYTKPIRRSCSKRLPKPEQTEKEKETMTLRQIQKNRRRHIENLKRIEQAEFIAEETDYDPLESILRSPSENRPYEVVLNSCGDSAEATVTTDSFMMGCKIHFNYWGLIEVYKDRGKYMPGYGFVIQMTEMEFYNFNEMFLSLKPIN
jgi:hypothetical protein